VEALRLLRRERTTFYGRFFERDPLLFASIARAAKVFADRSDWPDVSEYDALFCDCAKPVHFELAPPKRRRTGDEPIVRAALYDAMIVERRIVPTRPRMWHDYLNALVWASFPKAKLALHERQHRAIEAWIPKSATRLPNARTRELDALALVDEGAILIVEKSIESGAQYQLVFGHALLEGLVLDNRAMIARGVRLVADRDATCDLPNEIDARVALADELLEKALRAPSRIRTPDDLPRLPRVPA
jgi:hypothetical protein